MSTRPVRSNSPRTTRSRRPYAAAGRRPYAAAAGLVALAVTTAGLAGCSGSGSSSGSDKDPKKAPPSSTAPAGPAGTASLKVTGGDETPGSYHLAYTPGEDDTFDPTAGKIELTWSDSAHHVLHLSTYEEKLATGKVDATTTLKFGGEDKGYVDGVHAKCEVVLTSVGADAIAGRYNCRGVPGFSFTDTEQLDTSVDAQGTFTYARKGALPPAPTTDPGAPGGANTANLVVTGGDGPQGSYPLTYDPSAANIWEPSDGRYNLTWSDSAHHAVELTGVDTELTAGSKANFGVTLRVAGDDTGFVDSMGTQCTVTLTRAAEKSVAGSFECHAIPGFDFKASEEKPTKLDAHGTFDYVG